jgi:hypothetical protein
MTRIQWSVIIMSDRTSLRGMWHSMQPERSETGQGLPASRSWQERQFGS